MPRYPNLWFYLDAAFLPRPEYPYALRVLIRILEDYTGLKDSFSQDIHNHGLYHLLDRPGEGSDFQARIGPLQFYRDPQDPELSHWHQTHARFYASPLLENRKHRVKISHREREGVFFIIPVSIHYEVATEEKRHPYVDSCPLCGIAAEYNIPLGTNKEDYCMKIHDPLGLEFLVHGKIRGNYVYGPDSGRIRSLSDLERHFNCVIEETTPDSDCTDCLRLAQVLISPYEQKNMGNSISAV